MFDVIFPDPLNAWLVGLGILWVIGLGLLVLCTVAATLDLICELIVWMELRRKQCKS